MRKNFLLLFLLALLPMAGWAANPVQKTGLTWTGVAQELATAGDDAGYHYRYYVATTYTANRPQYTGYSANTNFNNNTSVNVPTGTAAGTYYVFWVRSTSEVDVNTWNYATTGNYGNFTVTIAKAQPTVTLLGFSKPYQATGWVEPTVATMPSSSYSFDADGTNLTFANIQNVLSWSRNSSSTDVGSYTYTLNVSGTNNNYDIKVSPGTFTITAVDGTWTTTPAGYAAGSSVKYDGTDKTVADLIKTEAVYSGGTVEYSLDGLAWSEDLSTIVVGKDAGTYPVQYRGNGDKNHNDIAGLGTFDVLIDPYEVTVGTDFNALTAITPNVYTGNPLPLVSEVAWTGTFASELAGAVIKYNSATAIPTETNVGVYPVALTFDFTATPNFTYAGTAISVNGEITKADIVAADVTAPTGKTGLTYKLDTPQQLINAAVCTKGVAWYSVDGGAWDTDITKVVGEHVKANNAPYVVSWYIVGDANHNNYGSTANPAGTVNVTIAPVQFALAADAEVATGLVFDNTAQPLLSKSVTGGAANMPTGSTTWSLDGTALAASSVYTDVKGTHAGEYTISYTVVPKDAKYENDYLPYTKELTATIGQYTLYIGGNEIKNKTIEEVVDLATGTPKITMDQFIKDGAFIGGESDADKATILNSLIEPTQTLAEIIDNAKLGVNAVGLKAVSVTPAKNKLTNYKVDAAHLLSNSASLEIVAMEAAIQTAPVGYTDTELTYNGGNQKLVKTAGVGYKANGGAGTVAIGKIVYSLTGEDGSWTDVDPTTDATTIIGKDADTYTVYYKVELDDSEDAENKDKFYEYTDGVKSFQVKINQKALTADMFVFSPDVEYNGQYQKPTITTKEGEPIVAADYTFAVTDGEDAPIDVEKLINADAYTFTFTATADGNYKTPTAPATVTKVWNITQKTLTADMFVFSPDVEYNGQYQKPTITTKEGEPIVAADYGYTITDGKDAAIDEAKLIDADTYTYTFTAKADGNYKNPEAPATVAIEWTIAQATAEIVLPTANNLTYNATDQALVTEGTTDAVDGLVEYQIKDSKDAVIVDWTDKYADVVQKNAGDYKVYYRITASAKNYTNPNVANAAEKPVAVTINKATVGYNLGNLTKTWDGELFGEEEIGSLFTLYSGGEGGLLFGDDEYDRPFVITLPEDYRDAGTYTFKQPTVTFKTKAGGFTKDYPVNYNVNFSGEAEVIINKADITEDDFNAPTIISPLTYDPTGELNPQALVNAGEVTAKYDAEYPTTELAGKAYGTIYYAQATTIPAIPETEEAWAASEVWNTNAPAESDAGSYPVWYVVKGDKNHNNFVVETALPAAIGQYELSEEFLPETYKTALPYKGSSYVATDFVPELVGLTEGVDYTVGVSDMTNVKNDYTLLYAAKENSNYTGEFTVTVAVTPIDVIAVAPKGIKKVYDGTASLEGVITNEDITFVGVLSGDQIAVPEALALSTEGIAVSDKPYAITVDADAINEIAANKNYNILDETIDGTLTITKAPAFKVGFDAVPTTWTKKFGETDPELTGYTVKVTGDFFDDLADVLAATTAERAEGENVGEYDVTLTIDETADVFANYEGVEFDGTAATFEITKAEKEYTVSIANITKTYKGEAFETAIEFTADDLVIAGYTGDKAKFFVDKDGNATLPTATLAAGAKNVGDYNITLSEGSSLNYNFTFVPATFTIEPVYVTGEIENKPVTAIGEDGTEVLKRVVWSVEAADAADATTVQNALEAELFAVQFTAGVVDTNNKIATEDGANALTLAYIGGDGNFEFETAVFGDLTIGETSTVIALDDSEAIETTAGKANVTFTQNRPVPMDTWQACVLPFTVSIEELSDVFGYAAVDLFDKDRTTAEEVHFSLQVSGSIEAGTPFLFKTNNDTNFTDVMFEGVNVVATSTLDPVVVDDKGDGADATGIKFIGTFTGENITTSGYRYLSKGTWYSTADGKSKPYVIKPLRSYLDMNGNASARIFIEEPDGTTSIMSVSNFNNMMNEGWYTIEGKKLDQAPTQKGVYIQNGKKVVIK